MTSENKYGINRNRSVTFRDIINAISVVVIFPAPFILKELYPNQPIINFLFGGIINVMFFWVISIFLLYKIDVLIFGKTNRSKVNNVEALSEKKDKIEPS